MYFRAIYLWGTMCTYEQNINIVNEMWDRPNLYGIRIIPCKIYSPKYICIILVWGYWTLSHIWKLQIRITLLYIRSQYYMYAFLPKHILFIICGANWKSIQFSTRRKWHCLYTKYFLQRKFIKLTYPEDVYMRQRVVSSLILTAIEVKSWTVIYTLCFTAFMWIVAWLDRFRK